MQKMLRRLNPEYFTVIERPLDREGVEFPATVPDLSEYISEGSSCEVAARQVVDVLFRSLGTSRDGYREARAMTATLRFIDPTPQQKKHRNQREYPESHLKEHT